MNATTILTDPAVISEYVDDPYREIGGAVHCQDVWRRFYRLPSNEQAVTRDSEEYRILSVEMPVEDLDECTEAQLGTLFRAYCLPGFYLKTPAPEWANEFHQFKPDAESGSCAHGVEVETGGAPVWAYIERTDTYEHSSGQITIGTPMARIEVEDMHGDFDAEDLRKIGAAALNAADQLEVIRAGEAK